MSHRVIYHLRPVLLAAGLSAVAQPVLAALTLQQATEGALQQDRWQQQNRAEEQALRHEATAAAALPDPTMRLALANLPTDSFDIDQENMTQLQLGLSQVFPRGNSLQLQQQRLQLMAGRNPLARMERRGQIRKQVGQLWLDLYSSQAQIRLIERNRALFSQLVDVAEANYRAGVSRSSDLVRAELELTRLDDRISRLRQLRDSKRGQLAQWLPLEQSRQLVSRHRPELDHHSVDFQRLPQRLMAHPRVLLAEQQIDIARKQVELAEQAYKPAYKVDLGYGYRDDMPGGRERADFFSAAVSFDLPLFTEKKQDPARNAARSRVEAAREARLLLLQQMRGQFETLHAEQQRLGERQALFELKLLPQLAQRREAALQSYSAGNGGFDEVMRAAITELDTRLQQIELQSAQQKNQLGLNYLLQTEAGDRD
ncbi:TolC family protein [Marinobacterium jannaschii]|uniref:TolC family protein n=1 Tax=Marinobacterium jannaschii TaxID=64970 RepID=UPI0004893FF7|nr:TolC family protein [Marinobacterium jannaschii]